MVPNMPLLIAIVTVLTAAVLQDLIPVTTLLPVKGYFLTAVTAYYVMEKPKLMGFSVLLWAGMYTDLLGGLPHGCTFFFLLVASPLLLLFKRILTEATLLHGTCIVAVLSVAQQVWTHIWVRHSGVALLSVDMLKLAGASAVMGLFTGFSMFLLCKWLERFKGVVERASSDVEGLNGIV